MAYNPQKEFECNLKKAEAGDPEAQYQVHNAYFEGIGVDVDIEQGFVWCKRAADNGHVIAAGLTGLFERMKGNMKEAVKYWEMASQNGDMQSAAELAEVYIDGAEGVPKNEPRAVELLKMASDSGVAKAQYRLGLCHATGNGVHEDIKIAAKLFEKSALQDDEMGMKSFAICLLNGFGIEKNEAQAAEWFKKSAAKGNIEAKLYLANMLALGNRVVENHKRSEELFQEIIADGESPWYGDAHSGLAALYATKMGDVVRAYPHWRESAQRGDKDSQFNLGLCYHNGWAFQRMMSRLYTGGNNRLHKGIRMLNII